MKLPGVRRIGYLGYWAAAVVALLVGALYWTMMSARESARLIDHTILVLNELDALSDGFGDAKAAQRSFLISRQPDLLARRDLAFDAIRDRLDRLRTLTSDNEAQGRSVGILADLMAQRSALMTSEVELREAGSAFFDIWANPAREGSNAALSRVIAKLRGTESSFLKSRRQDQKTALAEIVEVLLAALVACIAMMIPAYIAFVGRGRAREEAERRLLELAESVPGAVFQYRRFPDGMARYEFLSHGFEKLRGIDRKAALEDPEAVLGTILESDRSELRRAIDAAEKSGADLEQSYRVLDKNGQIRWVCTSAAPSLQKDGSVLWSGIWTDVTERHSMRHALLEAKEGAEAANRAKTNFVTTMSHEIRTPMNGVLGMLELLGRTELNGEQRAMLQVIGDSGRALLRIIDDILDFSKIEAGKLSLNPEPTSIARLVDSVVAVYAGVADDKGLVLTRTVDGRISPAVMVDALRLRQVLGNLLSNAIKFTAAGRVEIRAELIDRDAGTDIVRFSVRDTGIGISEEARKQLFRPFVQAAATTAQRYGGTGLGLAICQRLMTLMGGAIGAESEPGKGTVMMATIPLAAADPMALPQADGADATRELAREMPRPAPTTAAAEADGTLLLLADDHPTNRMILSRQVGLLGYASEVAENGFEALDKWRSGRFAMLITDCEMPQMDGYELARNIRAAESLSGSKRCVIVACTAYAGMGQAEKCHAAGMDDYLSKPVDLKRLREKLATWLPIPREAASGPGDEGKPPVDAAALAEVCGGDRVMEREFLARFQACNDEDASMLQKAVADPDLPEVAQISHRMKGASRTVGAMPLASACERIERAARASDASGVISGMPPFDRELARLNRYFRAHYPS